MSKHRHPSNRAERMALKQKKDRKKVYHSFSELVEQINKNHEEPEGSEENIKHENDFA